LANAMSAGALVLLAAGCTILPQGGPRYRAIIDAPTDDVAHPDYRLVRPNAEIARATHVSTDLAFTSDFIAQSDVDPTLLRPGDVLTITIWEPTDVGLFAASEGKEIIPHVVVDRNGEIFVPFIGPIEVQGLTTGEMREQLEAALAQRTLAPQVLVVREESPENMVVVQGAVRKSGPVPLRPGVTRLLPVLSEAGGAARNPELTEVKIWRKGRSTRIWLDQVLTEPSANVALLPGDIIFVEEVPWVFRAFGVVNRIGTVPFPRREFSLLDGLALAGSINDLRADASGVFLFREELPEITKLLQVPVQSGGEAVYLFDFSRPETMFVADAFQMRAGDTLYVTNAPLDELRKVMSVITAFGAANRTVMTAPGIAE
jgi:polysaccharide biosynthesis/export protein